MDKLVEGGNSGQVLLSFSFSSFLKCLKPELFLLSLPASTLFEEKTFFKKLPRIRANQAPCAFNLKGANERFHVEAQRQVAD